MPELTTEQKFNFLDRAYEEASMHGADVSHASSGGEIVSALFESGLDDIADYWDGNFKAFGIR